MSGVNITVYDGKNASEAAQRAEAAAREAKEQASVTSGALTDPIPPGTESEPAVLPPGPAGQKVKFEPEPGFYQGFDEVTSDKRWYFYWNGTTWSLVDMGKLPHGQDGVDGASLLKLWSDTSSDYPYGENIAVRDADGVIHVSLVDNNTFPLTDETKWLSVGGGFKYEELGYLFKIIDADGNELASWDENGLLRTRHARNSIDAGAVEGLEENLKILSGSQQADSDLLQFLDATDGTIGYVDANGVWNLPKIKTSQVQVIPETNDVKVSNKRFFKIQNVDMLEVNIIRGKLPTDTSAARLPENLIIELSTNGKKLITLNVEAVVQGQGTTAPNMRKLGYTFDLYNSEWKSVDIKINELVTTDSFHVKAFYTDVTHTRDVGCNMLFYEMAKSRPVEQWFVPPILRTDDDVETPDVYTEDARWGTWGIPCIINWSGEFYGLYTWRLKKKRENYQVNRDNPNHIFIENQVYNVRLGARDYPDFESVATDYEFRSPRNITPEVETDVMDFFTYARGVYQGNIDLRTTYQDHLLLTAWLDSIIHGEVIGHKDSILNNVQYITYNGTHWQPLFTDGDACIGMNGTGALIKEETGFKFANKDIFQTIRLEFLPELKERYTELRNNGTLTFHKFRQIFGGISQKIPQKIYQDDYIKWGSFSQDVPTMNQIYFYLLKRLEWLDTQWLNQ